jgi:hypothetical protein
MSGRQLQRAWNRQTFTVTDRNYSSRNSGGGSAGNGRVEIGFDTVQGYDRVAGDAGMNYLGLHETGHNSSGGRAFYSAQREALRQRTGTSAGFFNTTIVNGNSVLANPEAIANEQYANSFAESVGMAVGLPVYQQPYGTLP